MDLRRATAPRNVVVPSVAPLACRNAASEVRGEAGTGNGTERMQRARCAVAVVGRDRGVADTTERALRADAELSVHRVSACGEPALYAEYAIIAAVVPSGAIA